MSPGCRSRTCLKQIMSLPPDRSANPGYVPPLCLYLGLGLAPDIGGDIRDNSFHCYNTRVRNLLSNMIKELTSIPLRSYLLKVRVTSSVKPTMLLILKL